MGERGPKKGYPNRYKGIPRDQWPERRIERGEAPLAVGSHAETVGAVPVAEVPRETLQGIGWQGDKTQDPGVEAVAPAPELSSIPRRAEPPPPAPRPRDPVAPPPNLFAAGVQSLAVYALDGSTKDPLPGFRLHWFREEGPRLQQARLTGWAHVRADEVLVGEGINNDVGSNIRANASKSGPGYLYLMKKPLSIEEAHQKEYRETQILPIKERLKSGQISGDPSDMQYVKKDVHRIDDSRTYREGQT
jgi:hypothetical protein